MSKLITHPDGTPLTIEELLHQIEANDRRFRLAQGVFMFVVGGILMVLLTAQYNTIIAFDKQSNERREGLQQVQQATKNSVDETERYIYCIAQFFANNDRSNWVISDLENCKITRAE